MKKVEVEFKPRDLVFYGKTSHQRWEVVHVAYEKVWIRSLFSGVDVVAYPEDCTPIGGS